MQWLQKAIDRAVDAAKQVVKQGHGQERGTQG